MRRRFLIPETIQTSAMDCGPAALRSLLGGYGIECSYGRLREACQTEIDGTSIDQIETTAVQLGLEATQVMLPVDHLLDVEAQTLPAMVVVRNPDGATHLVVVWSRHGGWLQVMDPAVGRRWMRTTQFLEEIYRHTMAVEASAWREWAGSENFLATLRRRIRRTGADPEPLIAAACADAGAGKLSRLDAVTRLVEVLAVSRAIERGPEAARVLGTLVTSDTPIADEYWSAVPNGETVQIRGVVLVQVSGTRPPAPIRELTPELAAALTEKPARPWTEFLQHAFGEERLGLGLVVMALLVSAAAVAGEAILLRAFFDIGRKLTTLGERAGGLAALAAFSAALLAVEFSLRKKVLQLGRRLECGLRVRFQEKLPRLADRYFRSRPISDMADRSHNVHQLRHAPELAAQFLRPLFELLLTTVAITWLFPQAGIWAVGIALVAVGVPIAAQPLLAERDLRLRTHSGTLTRFYLDALLGLTAIRCHRGERGVRREQVNLLGKWARTGLALQRTVTTVEGLQFGGSLLIAGWLVWNVVGTAGDVGGLLLLTYWVLNLPVLGQEAANALWQYPMLRNTTLRLLEPLGAPEDPDVERTGTPAIAPRAAGPVALCWEGVTVRAGGHVILDRIDLTIRPGAHIGIVGASGAGKSSLVGLLLGWHKASEGRVLADGESLEGSVLAQLRAETAWVDPQIQIWNRSLYENIRYGTADDVAMDEVLRTAELMGVVQRLPAGLQTRLGEGGGLVSGGEGQRVRLARGLARSRVRLVVLDEPARGLDRAARRELVRRTRERWRDATLICITHDVSDTRDFERVLVIDGGRVAEDGPPAGLAAKPDSRYRKMLDTEAGLHRDLWASARWRHLRLDQGRLKPERGENDPGAAPPSTRSQTSSLP